MIEEVKKEYSDVLNQISTKDSELSNERKIVNKYKILEAKLLDIDADVLQAVENIEFSKTDVTSGGYISSDQAIETKISSVASSIVSIHNDISTVKTEIATKKTEHEEKQKQIENEIKSLKSRQEHLETLINELGG